MKFLKRRLLDSALHSLREAGLYARITLLPITHVLVDTWTLIVKPIYKLLNVSDDLKWTTNTHMTPFSLTFKALLTISMVLEDLFCFFAPSVFYLSTTRPPIFSPVHIRFYLSK